MYPAAYRYLRVSSVAEAVDTLAEVGSEGRVLAGGASLIPWMKYRQVSPAVLVDVGRLGELTGTHRVNGALAIGATTRHADVAADDAAVSSLPLAGDVAAGIGDQQVRNMGTVGGGLAAVEPTGDWGPALLAVNGSVTAMSRQGQRDIPATDLFAAPLTPTLRSDELLTEVRLPVGRGRTGSAHVKFHLRAVTALGSCAVALSLDDEGRMTDVGVGVGGLTPIPVRVLAATAVLQGQPLSVEIAEDAAAAVMDALDTHADSKTSAAHRRRVAGSLFTRALTLAYDRAAGAATPTPAGGTS
ncbi:MAG: FAD binding domain-containing protein [Actinomycetes bacterium]